MDLEKNCKILKIYVSEDSKYKGHSLYHAIILKLRELGIAGATVIRGIEGFGQDKRLHTARIVDASLSLPVVIEAIDNEDKINAVIPHIKAMLNEGLMITADINVIKYGN